MESLGKRLRRGKWSLAVSRSLADEVGSSEVAVRTLVRELFGDDPEVRKRAADVARRVTDRDGRVLESYADELAGLLDSIPPDEVRTRWHLGLVVPRIAHTHMQRTRAARTMSLLSNDESNVVRCSAVEGMTHLALQDASLREEAKELIESFLRVGTPAMKCRARYAQRKLQSCRKDDGQ